MTMNPNGARNVEEYWRDFRGPVDHEREFEEHMAPRAQHDTDEMRLFVAGCAMSLVAVAIVFVGWLCGF